MCRSTTSQRRPRSRLTFAVVASSTSSSVRPCSSASFSATARVCLGSVQFSPLRLERLRSGVGLQHDVLKVQTAGDVPGGMEAGVEAWPAICRNPYLRPPARSCRPLGSSA